MSSAKSSTPPTTTSEGRKDDQGKSRLELVPPLAELEVGQALRVGAERYGAYNWKHVEDWRYLGAAKRHIAQYISGEQRASDSRVHHLAHAVCSLMFVLEKELEAERNSSEEPTCDRCTDRESLWEDSKRFFSGT